MLRAQARIPVGDIEDLALTRYILFSVPGDCVPKGRGRAFVQKRGRKAGKIMVRTPDKTRDFEAKVRSCFREAIGGEAKQWTPPAARCTLSVLSCIREPKGTPKWLRELAEWRWRGKKPDEDNLRKAVADALNGVAWQDDAQIVRGTSYKVEGPYAQTCVLVQYLKEPERGG